VPRRTILSIFSSFGIITGRMHWWIRVLQWPYYLQDILCQEFGILIAGIIAYIHLYVYNMFGVWYYLFVPLVLFVIIVVLILAISYYMQDVTCYNHATEPIFDQLDTLTLTGLEGEYTAKRSTPPSLHPMMHQQQLHHHHDGGEEEEVIAEENEDDEDDDDEEEEDANSQQQQQQATSSSSKTLYRKHTIPYLLQDPAEEHTDYDDEVTEFTPPETSRGGDFVLPLTTRRSYNITKNNNNNNYLPTTARMYNAHDLVVEDHQDST